MDDELIARIRDNLPPYWSAETKRQLVEQLTQYGVSRDYYGTIPGEDEPVQGDAWRGFIVLDFATAERDAVVGLVVSNSCDITALNRPSPDQNLLFAPVLDLDQYARFLRNSGMTEQQVGDILVDIRAQKIHRLFYLPAMHGVIGESVVALDAIHAQPLSSIDPKGIQRVLRLNAFGWYILLIKLSIHFTRTNEQLDRQNQAAAPA